MNRIIILMLTLSVFTSAFASSDNVSIAKTGARIIITAQDDSAQLCPEVNCGQYAEILMLPTNTRLNVIAIDKQLFPQRFIVWYKVIYGGKSGWVSEFDTNLAPAAPRYR